MLAVPTMLAASGYDLLRSGAAFSSEHWGLLAVGFVTAFIVAILSIRFMLSLLSRYGFLPFGLYRVAIGGIYALVFLR
jgi:undecaprenyl-diphosphatase